MKFKFVGNGIGFRSREIKMMMRGDYDVFILYWKAWKLRELVVDNGYGTCNVFYIKFSVYFNNLVLENFGFLVNLYIE